MSDAPSAQEAPDELRRALERTLGHQYKIVRLLGRGGMGAVYLAREQALDRLVAIKVLAKAAEPDEDSRERFRREARTAAGLSHANIVPLHGFGEIDGMLYLVMGFVSGESLRDRLKRESHVPEQEARRILADVAEALDYAHRHNVVHRDVKPDNILIEDETGRAFLADFGIAKGLDGGQELTRVGQVVGTPLYMSPEQAAGKDVDPRSDLYSLGAVAFTMLAGRPPFETKTMQEAILKRHTEDAPSLASIAAGVPADLATAADRCLARDPEKRLQSARAFRQAVAPDALVEDDLPEPLDTLDGKAVLILGLVFALCFVALSVLATGMERDYRQKRGEKGRPDPSVLLLIVLFGAFAMQAPILGSAARTARRRGFSHRQILGAFLRQPRWWPCFWFPRRFRRNDDVWERLPGPFRLWRVVATIFVIGAIALIGVFSVAYLTDWLDLEAVEKTVETLGLGPSIALSFTIVTGSVQLLLIALLLAMFVAPIALLLCARLMHRQGLDTYDLRRVSRTMMVGPTSDKAPWRKPEVARLLLPPKPRGNALVGEPQTPTEISQALGRLNAELNGEARVLAGEAAESARRLGVSLSRIDREIARLTEGLDPKEADRLKDQIRKIGSDPGAEEADQRELKDLLQKQSALFERRATRREQMLVERALLLKLLSDLWQAARRLRSTGDPAAPDLLRRALSQSRAAAGDDANEGVSSTSVTVDRV